ncbi:MAG: squalene--hopene cyclase [Okeania sp. SIO2G4]|uniref:squalene--hopene cyclase n=1 Tax=unclassified Okeania TaxID=2634635 RepID=UPI0013BD1CEE|nr:MULTISPECIES: squalene--hopene cyclase [unclassified Okeania]NEP71455.1 squalene--hopene cyclase [Okeania sp. SIO2G5]NEP96190.1 squalene--hopene cyclase [Okeania sp. SIO2F5]NEQ93959.1 squalene--hopene cyclase [Okeania sp. SIO2G4]
MTEKNKVQQSILASQEYLLNLQKPQGYWWDELESNVTITAEIVLLHKIWQIDNKRPLDKAKNHLISQQREHCGWELFYGDGGDLSTSIEAYMALRLLGVAKTDPIMLKAQDFIIKKGGISCSRIFTKLHLALIGCFNWQGIPSIPPSIMLLPEDFPFTIYEMSSWARSSTVPLLIVFDKKPIFSVNPTINLDELYAEGINNATFELPRQYDWTDLFLGLDKAFKFAENFNLMPLREEGLKAAEKWILERQEVTGDWGGIIPAMLNSMLALRCLEYDVADPVVVRGLEAIDKFAVETEYDYWVQPCVSPVWDTAWVIRSLVDSGIPPSHPAVLKAGEWLLQQQILDYGDWAIKNKLGKPGGWAFEFINRFYPDIDDTAVVVMALDAVELPDEELKRVAIARAMEWVASMQCQPGGWAAFDVDNDQDWLNGIPYGDLKAMIDPNTADVTARVLEMVGCCRLSMDSWRVKRAIAYLEREQEGEGCWFGRWGVNYIYGTSGVISALAVVAQESHRDFIEKGASWLVGCQNSDGGWGESCWSYNDPSLKGKGKSTASQTAWALIGLLAAGEATGNFAREAIDGGVDFLVSTQKDDGSWLESEFTGTGFPCHFYIKYHFYPQYFPLMALGKYENLLSG